MAVLLAITAQPAGAVDNTVFTTQPIVELRDNHNSLYSGSAQITAAIASGSGTLSGTLTVSALNGVAVFTNLKIIGTGAHTLRFTSSGLNSATSNSFTVASGAATQLAITTQPSGAVDGVNFVTQPVVEVRTAGGALVTGSSASVTVAKLSGSGTLSGTLTKAAVNGVVTFTDLKITGTGAHTLRFTSSGLTQADSSSFTVSAASGTIWFGPGTAEDGTLDFFTGGTTPGEVANVVDPLNGANRAYRISYGTGPGAPDENHFGIVGLPQAALGFGQDLWIGFRLMNPAGTIGYANDAIQKKLIYVRHDSRPLGLIPKLWGDNLRYAWFDGFQDFEVSFGDLGAAGNWYTVKYQIRMNSAVGVADGFVKCWLDGVLLATHSGKEFCKDGSAFAGGYDFGIGYQRESGSGDTTGTEFRYWDDVWAADYEAF